MNVLIVASADEEFGGVASVMQNLARYLRGRGHEVFFFHPGQSTFMKTRITKAGFTGYELNLQMWFRQYFFLIRPLFLLVRFPLAMYQLIRIIQKRQIDVVNIHYPGEFAVFFALCRRIMSFSLVTSVHGADLFPGGKRQDSYPQRIRFLLKSSDRVVAPSKRHQADVAAVFPFLQKELTFIHNGVDLEELQRPQGGMIPYSHGSYVLCIAMHNKKKGLDVLLRAFALLRNTAPSLKLLLVGDGPLRGELERLALCLGLTDRIQFLGLRGREEVARLLHGCEVFVLPSRSEPFGIVVIEALACKKPVIATTVGGIPEIIENGKTGLLIEPDNPEALAAALTNVLQNESLRLAIARAGNAMVREKFNTKNMGASYEAIFDDLMTSVKKREASRGALFPVQKS
jgi:L-malate glycosyltransferase